MFDLRLPQIDHAFAALLLVADDGGRALVLRPPELAAPDRETVDHASRERLETARLPALIPCGQIEGWLSVEAIEVLADECGFLQTDAIVPDEVRHATRWIDGVVRT